MLFCISAPVSRQDWIKCLQPQARLCPAVVFLPERQLKTLLPGRAGPSQGLKKPQEFVSAAFVISG